MKRGLKKFLAMLSVVSLVSGVGAIGCAAVNYFGLKDGAKIDGNWKKYFNEYTLGSTKYYDKKSDLDDTGSKAADDLLKDFVPYNMLPVSEIDGYRSQIADLEKGQGMSAGKVVAIGAGTAVVGMAVGAIVDGIVRSCPSDNSESKS